MISAFHQRPAVYDYGSPIDFLTDLMAYYKTHGSFSLRQRTDKVGACSQALVSQILKGRRQLTRDNFPGVAQVFKLTLAETRFIDEKLSARLHPLIETETIKTKSPRLPKNHLLSDWLNPYVKDLVNLKGFSLDAENLYSMLKGIASPHRIKKSVEFLIREGFWRTTANGQVVPEDASVITTNGIRNEKIRSFHKNALKLALRGMDELASEKRKASAVLLSVDREHFDELKGLIDSFQHQLLEFVEKHPNGSDSLVQVAMHLTSIGDSQND